MTTEITRNFIPSPILKSARFEVDGIRLSVSLPDLPSPSTVILWKSDSYGSNRLALPIAALDNIITILTEFRDQSK